MDYSIFSNNIEVIDNSIENFTLFFNKLNISKTINLKTINLNEAFFLETLQSENNQILLSMNDGIYEYYIYVNNGDVFLSKEYIEYEKKERYNNTFNFCIENKYDNISILQLGVCTLAIIIDNRIKKIISTEFFDKISFNDKVCSLQVETKINGVVSVAKLDENYLFLIYDKKKKEFILKKLKFSFLKQDEKVLVDIVDNNIIKLSYKDREKKVDLAKLKKSQPKKLFGKKEFEELKDKNLISIFILNKTRFYVFLKTNGLYIQKADPESVTKFNQNLKTISIGQKIYIFGRMTHNAYNSFYEYDYLYAGSSNHLLSKFTRPFKGIKFLKIFGYFKIDVKKMDIGDRVHYPLYIGSDKLALHRFKITLDNEPSKVYSINRGNPNIVVIRTDIYSYAAYSIVPNNQMYSISNLIKQKMALIISNYFYQKKSYNVNLYFEKMASKADESGFRVFERVMENKDWSSKNFYILDRSSKVYQSMKEKYGKYIIPRFSFKHYLAIYNADYFISSDLSNHVINDRIYINSISKKLKEVPLIFLQHGIMFAKPVENPMGRIFYKNYGAYNVYKNVVNSSLEAGEFYKMGYDDFDLLYSGLATFDFAKLDKTSDKIVYMPTYRYWEEGMIYSGDIEKTTYYKTLLKIIKAFENENLLDKLLLVSHNKFAEYIYESMPQYKQYFAENPSEALKVGRIFISDYSSAIYDAIYRGAYPIFYWEDKEYLITNYKANPPVNESNAPGPQAKSIEELMYYVRNAISNGYKLENTYQNKYKQINHFDDNCNTQRIVDFLKEDGIL